MNSLIFFGSGDYVIPIVDVLRKHGLELIITTEKEGRFLDYLKKENLPFIISNLKSEQDIEAIENKKPSIGILASYGAIVPKKIIDLFKYGIFNVHPSLLPKYKGPSPIQATILKGEKQTGTTIIKLDEMIDHGPIASYKAIELIGNENAEGLKNNLFKIGAELIDELLSDLEKNGEISTTPQDHTKEIMTSKVTRENGYIDINNPPNWQTLERMIRAYYPWPGVWTEYALLNKNRRIKLLPDQKIQVEGSKPMNYKDFINGFGKEAKELLEKLGIN